MSTSSLKDRLLGDTASYSQLLQPLGRHLIATYPDPDLRPLFATLPNRFISLAPMAICARLSADLGTPAPPELLQALGLLSFHISTHDDIIDEPPLSRSAQAALVYAGNITFIAGCQRLLDLLPPHKADFVLCQVTRNHFLQQRCVALLWDEAPHNFNSYALGVQHDGAFIGIGVCAALALANREALWLQLEPVCAAYGVAMQLLDDLLETEEDQLAGYHSYPLLEGPPFNDSHERLQTHLKRALWQTHPDLRQFNELLTNMSTVAERLREPALA